MIRKRAVQIENSGFHSAQRPGRDPFGFRLKSAKAVQLYG